MITGQGVGTGDVERDGDGERLGLREGVGVCVAKGLRVANGMSVDNGVGAAVGDRVGGGDRDATTAGGLSETITTSRLSQTVDGSGESPIPEREKLIAAGSALTIAQSESPGSPLTWSVVKYSVLGKASNVRGMSPETDKI
jgi:hypothetical protein